MKTLISQVFLGGALAGLAACGGPAGPQATDPPALLGHDQLQPRAPDILAGLQPAADEADVTFAVFHATPPKDAAKAVRLRLRSPPAELTAFLADAGAPPEITVSTVPNDDQLPLRREVLVAEAGPLGPALERAAAVSLVHATGRSSAQQGLLRWTAWAAVLAGGDDAVIVDLATWKSKDSKGFLASMGSADWLAAQVVPSAWEEGEATLGLTTRGMAKLGLPDVEWSVPKADARAAFDTFMGAVDALRTRGHAREGDAVGGFRLGPCQRPREAYTRTCVRLSAAP